MQDVKKQEVKLQDCKCKTCFWGNKIQENRPTWSENAKSEN